MKKKPLAKESISWFYSGGWSLISLKIKLIGGKTTIFLDDQKNFVSSLFPHYLNSVVSVIFLKSRILTQRKKKMKVREMRAPHWILNQKQNKNHRRLLTTYDKRDFNRLEYEKGYIVCRSLYTFFPYCSMLFNSRKTFRFHLFPYFGFSSCNF